MKKKIWLLHLNVGLSQWQNSSYVFWKGHYVTKGNRLKINGVLVGGRGGVGRGKQSWFWMTFVNMIDSCYAALTYRLGHQQACASKWKQMSPWTQPGHGKAAAQFYSKGSSLHHLEICRGGGRRGCLLPKPFPVTWLFIIIICSGYNSVFPEITTKYSSGSYCL